MATKTPADLLRSLRASQIIENEDEEKRFKCTQCPKAYLSSQALNLHIKIKHSKKLDKEETKKLDEAIKPLIDSRKRKSPSQDWPNPTIPEPTQDEPDS